AAGLASAVTATTPAGGAWSAHGLWLPWHAHQSGTGHCSGAPLGLRRALRDRMRCAGTHLRLAREARSRVASPGQPGTGGALHGHTVAADPLRHWSYGPGGFGLVGWQWSLAGRLADGTGALTGWARGGESDLRRWHAPCRGWSAGAGDLAATLRHRPAYGVAS